MPAQLSEAHGHNPHQLVLPERLDGRLSALAELELALADTVAIASGADGVSTAAAGAVVLVAGRWRLDARQLGDIESLLKRHGLNLTAISSDHPDTRVAAAGLGFQADAQRAGARPQVQGNGDSGEPKPQARPSTALRLHRGTLRSGDHLEVEGSLLLLGDVNPGASIRAGGHVLVWGRLRGTAHAGAEGDREARITALQLCPLQLRIADAVARGPEGVPPPGLAEEAALVDGAIQIRAAAPTWPLSD